ncbi:EamA family transporter [Aurantimonas aggregata]|uniref:EamA family transporter n=1 Tax=Aurantimonas aggregata TaxID=2047720 RepID=A0A6L9MCP8_9HYPH|nr:DMT family transporter [Aurantimonas aggregata]NDV85594.1 EamA family transporter [Aurantimonas aggregata]
MSRLSANLLLLLAGAVWGMGFVAQSTAMDAVGPWTYTAAKFAVAAIALVPFAILEARRATAPLPSSARTGFVLVGLMLFAGAILQQIGIVTTSVTNAGFLTGLYVVFTPILAFVLLRARPHWVVWPSALAAFAGIVLLGGGGVAAPGLGDWLMVACAVFFALQIIAVGFFAGPTGRPLTLSFTQFAVAAVLAGVGMLVLEAPTLAALTAAWPEILYGGLFSTALAFTLQTIGQRHTTAAQAAIFLSSEALFAALFAALLLGERIAAIGILGCILIFGAMLAVEIVPLRVARTAKV